MTTTHPSNIFLRPHWVGCILVGAFCAAGLLSCASPTPSPLPPTTPRATTLHASATPSPTPTSLAISVDTAPYLEKVARFGKGSAEAVSWSPDGKLIVVATSLGVDLYDAQTFAQTGFLDTGQWNIRLAFSRDSQWLALTSREGPVQVWDVAQQSRRYTLASGGVPVAFSPDGAKLATANAGTVRIWEAQTGQALAAFPGYGEGVELLAFAPDGRVLLAAGWNGVRVRDLDTGELLYPSIEGSVDAVFFSLDGQHFATVGQSTADALDVRYQSTIRYWDTATGKQTNSFVIANDIVYGFAVSLDQHWTVVGGLKGISIWDKTSEVVANPIPGQTGAVNALAFSPDGQQLATIENSFGGDDGVRIFDFATRKVVKTFDEYSSRLPTAALSADGKQVVSAGLNRRVQIRDTVTGALLHQKTGNRPLALSPTGEFLAFASGSEQEFPVNDNSYNNFVELWAMQPGELLDKKVFSCPSASAIAFSPDGQMAAYGGDECVVRILSTASGEVLHILSQAQNYDNRVYLESLAFSPDGRILAVGGYYKIELWDIQAEKLLSTIEDLGFYFAGQVAFSPDGRYLVIGGLGESVANKQVQLWDAAGARLVLTFDTQQSQINHLAFSPDGQVLAVGGSAAYDRKESGNVVELWDAWAGQFLATLPVSTRELVGLGFSADGQTLMTAGEDGAFELWQVRAAPISVSLATPRPTPTAAPSYTPTSTPPPITITQIVTLGKGLLSPIIRSRDGKLIALTEGQALRWFDAATFEEVGSVTLENDWGLGGVYFSPDSRYVVAESGLGASIVDLTTGKIIGRVASPNGFVSGFTFSPDGRYMAYLDGDRTTGGPYHAINVFDLARGETLNYLDESGKPRFETRLPDRYHIMSDPAISPDGKWLAAGHSDKHIYVWDLATGQTRFVLEGHAGHVSAVDFSPDGRYLASGSWDGTVRLWNAATSQLVRVVTGFLNDVVGVKFVDQGRRLRVSVYDQPDQVWDMQAGRLSTWVAPTATPDPFALYMHQQGYAESGGATFVQFSPDGRDLTLVKGNVLVWEVNTRQLRAAIEGPGNSVVLGMAYGPDGTQLATINEDGSIRAWNTQTGKRILELTSEILQAEQVYYAAGEGVSVGIGAGARGEQGLAFSPDGKRLAFGNGPAIEIWNVATTRKILTLAQNEPLAYATRVSFSEDGQRLYAVLNLNRRAAVWDANTGALLREVALPKVDPNAFSATDLRGPLFARNNYDDQGYWIERWNLDTGEMLRLDTPARETEPLRFSPDGRLLVAVINDQLHFWSTQTGQLVYQTKETFEVGGLAFSPDNLTLAIGTYGKAELWDIRAIAHWADQPGVFFPTPPPPTPTPKVVSAATATPYPTPAVTPLPTSPTGAIAPLNAARVVERARFGQGVIKQVLWTSNAILVASSEGVFQYDAVTLTETTRITSETPVDSLTALPDGRLFAAGVRDNHVLTWDVSTGEALADIPDGQSPALSADGKQLVYVDSNANLHTWDLTAQKPMATLHSSSRTVSSPVFSPDGQWVTAIQYPVRVWDARTGAIVNALNGPANTLTDLSFSADGQYLAGAGDGSAWIWEVRPGAPPYTITLYQGRIDGNLDLYDQSVTAAALSPDNRLIAIGDSEKQIWLYDRQSRMLLRQLQGHSNTLRFLRFSRDGAYLLSVDSDGSLMLWEVATGKRLSAQFAHLDSLGGLVFRPDGNLSVWAGGTAWTVRPSDGVLLNATRIYSGTILAASPLGDWLAVYSPYRMSLWDARTGEYRQMLEGEAKEPWVEYYWEGLIFRGFHEATFGADGRQLFVAGTGGIWIYDAQTGRLLQQIQGNNARGLVVSADAQWLITSLDDPASSPAVLDLQTGETAFTPGEERNNYRQFAFSLDKYWLAMVAQPWEEPAQLELWDTSTHQLLKSLTLGQDTTVTSLSFSPDARLIAMGQADGRIILIDLATFKEIATLPGHRYRVEHLDFSTDGRYLASAGRDGTVRVWGVP